MGDLSNVARIGDRVYGFRWSDPTRKMHGGSSPYEFTPLTPCGTCGGGSGPMDDTKTPYCSDCSGKGAGRCGECEGGGSAFRGSGDEAVKWLDSDDEIPEKNRIDCLSPGCWHGYERSWAMQAEMHNGDNHTVYAEPITMTDRQARDMGATALEGEVQLLTRGFGRSLEGVKIEEALIAAWILAHD